MKPQDFSSLKTTKSFYVSHTRLQNPLELSGTARIAASREDEGPDDLILEEVLLTTICLRTLEDQKNNNPYIALTKEEYVSGF